MEREDTARYHYRRPLNMTELPAWDDDTAQENEPGESILDLRSLQSGEFFTVRTGDTERLFVKETEDDGAMKGWRELRLDERTQDLQVVRAEFTLLEPNPYGESFAVWHTTLLYEGYELGIRYPDEAPYEIKNAGQIGKLHAGKVDTPDAMIVANQQSE